MVVHRRPAELQTEVPAAVYALDLTRLSELLNINENELVGGFSAHPSASEMQGVIVDAGENVPFEAVGHVPGSPNAGDNVVIPMGALEAKLTPRIVVQRSPHTIERKLVRQVLLTAAARPSSLDAHELPKCLIQLGSQSVMAHILTQLYAAGVERIVISVAACGKQIMDHVRQTPYFHKMNIEFLDLGADNQDGHARSILAARKLFPRGPFLIHTADHIFDKSIISKLANYQLNEAVACVLVETDVVGLTGLPNTAVKVQLGKETVTKIGRDLERFDGFDAGLFLSSVAIFDALDDLAAKKTYFSLADALSYFTKFNKLVYMPTAGETWFSIETEEQLAYTQDHEGVSVLSPWTVFLAATPQELFDDDLIAPASKNVVMGISAPDQDASLRVAGNNESAAIFDGFVVGVNNSDRREEDFGFDVDDDSRLLLSMGYKSPFVSTRSRMRREDSFMEKAMGRENSFIETGAVEEPFVVSFPVDDETSQTIESMTSSRHAYLIEMNPDPKTPMSTSSQYMLAVPGAERPKTPVAPRRRRGLPSDIREISLETRGFDENLEVAVVIKRQTPLIGYVLLMSSLITISSVGVALDMEDGVAPLLKLFWRNTCTALTTLPLALLAIRRNGAPKVDKSLVMTMLLAGASYAFYLGSYVVSLSLTSVGHATLFNNAHSLLLVFVKLVLGQPVVLFEGLGAVIGVGGGAMTALDPTKASGGDIISATTYGDLVALAGAFGGATYFLMAKKLRARMDIVLFLCCLTATSATVLLISMLVMGQDISFSADVHNGIIGWINPLPDRLLMACYLSLVCDLIGTMGYISVLKYFDPIVISVFCLLEPIVASAMGIAMGVDGLPGIMTYFGATLVIGGTFLVIITQSKKTDHIDATEVIRAKNMQTPKMLYSTRAKRKAMNYGSMH